MADDPNPALRAELVAALAVVNPQIRGLHDLAATSISADLAAEIIKQVSAREHRRDLLNTTLQWLDGALHSLNALQADGYPDLPGAALPPALLTELKGEETDLGAAMATFIVEPATNISVALGAPTERSNAP